MLGIERSAARYTWTAAVVLLLLWLVYLLRSTLFVFALALLFAYLLSPLVDLLDRAIPRKGTRTLALALAYLIFIGVVVLVGDSDRHARGGAGADARQQASGNAGEVRAALAHGAGSDQRAQSPGDRQSPAGLGRSAAATSCARCRRPGMKFLSVASNLIYVVIVPVLAFFFLKDGDADPPPHSGDAGRGPVARRGGERDGRHSPAAGALHARAGAALPGHLHRLRHLLHHHGRAVRRAAGGGGDGRWSSSR